MRLSRDKLERYETVVKWFHTLPKVWGTAQSDILWMLISMSFLILSGKIGIISDLLSHLRENDQMFIYFNPTIEPAGSLLSNFQQSFVGALNCNYREFSIARARKRTSSLIRWENDSCLKKLWQLSQFTISHKWHVATKP